MALLIQQTMSTGYATYFPDPLGRLVDLPGNPKSRYVEISTAQASDAMIHTSEVIVAGSSDALKPTALILTSKSKKDSRDEVFYFKTSLDGILEKSVKIDGKNTADGKAIKGSGVITHLDISAPDVKERFQHELDLWLKGRYRKDAAPKSK